MASHIRVKNVMNVKRRDMEKWVRIQISVNHEYAKEAWPFMGKLVKDMIGEDKDNIEWVDKPVFHEVTNIEGIGLYEAWFKTKGET